MFRKLGLIRVCLFVVVVVELLQDASGWMATGEIVQEECDY